MLCMLFCVDLNKQLKLKKKTCCHFFQESREKLATFQKSTERHIFITLKLEQSQLFTGNPYTGCKTPCVNQFKPVFPVRRGQICTAPSQGQKCTRMIPPVRRFILLM